jgi:ABC-type antimicrobial peptide transport system permease subunit
VIGYGLGVGAAALFGIGVRGSELAFLLSTERLVTSGIAVLVVVLLSSALALRSVIKLEPAVVFRS